MQQNNRTDALNPKHVSTSTHQQIHTECTNLQTENEKLTFFKAVFKTIAN
jgi:hypothetical protein